MLDALDVDGKNKTVLDVIIKNKPLVAIYPLFAGNEEKLQKV